ncbi:type 1 glutamine amidotransferase [Caldicoprobacter guelmensis]|uniref:ThuA domain-containing protein n=1 Tax=Caldicoprobacter guelmensis TaxID=1170224 RepID=UPI0019575AB6|nr:type 1 glutamine amidotransferase [Caldicoprobacter guelmensis]
MEKKALIVRGGWEGHQPVEVSELFRDILVEEGFEVEISETLDAFLNVEKLKSLHLIIPVWTMGKITDAQVGPVLEAVASGVGIAGCHGGMCDAFRECVQWQFMTGGQWVAHPGGDGVEYIVNIKRGSSPIVEGIDDFTVRSEQYYVHIDPAIEVLATTRFPVVDGPHVANGHVDVPVIWTKRWGKGRVFYCSLGHHVDVLQMEPVRTIMRRGFLWAAEGYDIAMQVKDKEGISIQAIKRMF